MTPSAAIRELLTAALAPSELLIEDDSAQHAGHAGAREGGHYTVTIVSAAFAGQAPLARHRMVYAALGDLRALGVHALAIRARTPEESSV